MYAAVMKRPAPVLAPPPALPGRSVNLPDGSSIEDSDSSMGGQSSRKSSEDETVTLNVILPSGLSYPFKVNRRMPLMDLLVHAAAVHHFNPSDYAVYNPQARFHNSSLPNTPVGELGTEVVQIVPKNSSVLTTLNRPAASIKAQSIRLQATAEQPFEKTFRLQINLPHGQKTMLRVSPKQTLQTILGEICVERGLDERAFTLRNPRKPNQPLDMYRSLADEGTKEITMVQLPAAQGSNVAQNGQKFGTLTQQSNGMEPPRSPSRDQPSFGLNIFRLCRKKRMVSKELSDIPQHSPSPVTTTSRELPLRSTVLSKSMANLSEPTALSAPVESLAAPVKPSRSSKKPAPRPPPTTAPANPVSEAVVLPSYAAMEKAHRTRHHSESSGYDESLVNSNSPERDAGIGSGGGSVGRQTSSAGRPDLMNGGGEGSSGRQPVSARSSTSTPDSGLKSASEGILKSTVHVSKKKAPAPPPPPAAAAAPVTTPAKEPVIVHEDVKVEIRSRAASSISAASTSDKISIGSFSVSQSTQSSRSSVSMKGSPSKEASNGTLHAIVPGTDFEGPSLDQLEQEAADLIVTASFVYENGSQHSSISTAEQEFDSESSLNSLEIVPHHAEQSKYNPSSTAIDVEVHHEPDLNCLSPDWGDGPQKEPISLSRSFPLSTDTDAGFWLPVETPVVESADTDKPDFKSAAIGEPKKKESPIQAPVSSAEVQEETFVKEDRLPRQQLGTPPAFKGLFADSSAAAAATVHRRTSTSSESDRSVGKEKVLVPHAEEKSVSSSANPPTLDERISREPVHSDVSEKEREKVRKAPPLNLVIPQGEKDASLPSPSPSVASTASSITSLKAPPVPASTPPPVTSKTFQTNARRSPAHVSISSLADARPDRYRDLVAHQPGTPSTTAAPSTNEELLKEIRAVQEAIASLQVETQIVQLHASFTPDELTAISEKQRVLQEHIQRQILLTQQLLENERRTTTTPENTFTKPKISTAAELRALGSPITTTTTTTTNNPPATPTPAAIVAPSKKVPVVTKLPANQFTAPVKTSLAAAQPEGVSSRDDVFRHIRPKVQHRDSWIASDASRRFDFNQPSEKPAPSSSSSPVVASTAKASNGPNRNEPKLDQHGTERNERNEPNERTDPKVAQHRTARTEPILDQHGTERNERTQPNVEHRSSTAVARGDSTKRPDALPVRHGAVVTRMFSSPTRVDDTLIPRNVSVARNLTGTIHGGVADQIGDGSRGHQYSVSNGSSTSDNRPETNKFSSKDSYPVLAPGPETNKPPSQSPGKPVSKFPPVKIPYGGGASIAGVKTTDSLRDARPNPPIKARPVSQFIPTRGNSKEEPSDTPTPSGDFMESIVRGAKNGTASPYHHVQVSGVTSKSERRMVSSAVADSTPAPPPPPPPAVEPILRSTSVPATIKAQQVKRVEPKASSMREPSGSDQRAELCDAIKSFSVGSLRKVPTAAQKTWAPKIR
ncbi:hypothetical protein BV898_09751 [Hypsibius exemplaris]|uniref:RBD domain-containing protein n=1 Tax=Hypsibius exemplaris TaxID=2072580 RepID=A0A1W0WLN9_HYPEX|nr:hypothetical protein BV898_09751 [Hypsibius exemplaris]